MILNNLLGFSAELCSVLLDRTRILYIPELLNPLLVVFCTLGHIRHTDTKVFKRKGIITVSENVIIMLKFQIIFKSEITV